MTVAARLWFSAILILVVLTAKTAVVFWVVSERDQITSERALARQTLIQSANVLAILVNAETGQRGYLLTGLDRYLAPYNRAISDLPAALKTLHASAATMPALGDRVSRLSEISQAKMTELAATIAVRREQGIAAAEKIVETDRGKDSMDDARGVAGEIESVLLAEIEERDSEQRRARQLLFISVIAGAAVVAFFVIATNALLYRWAALPLRAIGQGIARIAAGDLTQNIVVRGRDELSLLARAFNSMTADLRAERANRVQAEADVARSDAALKAHGQELERYSQTVALLGRMANRLPSCTDEAEFIEVIQRYVPQIIPTMPGILYALSNSQTVLRQIADWRDPKGSGTEFAPQECWGLRRGQPHIIADVSTDVVCPHVHAGGIVGYCCLPLVAQGGNCRPPLPGGRADTRHRRRPRHSNIVGDDRLGAGQSSSARTVAQSVDPRSADRPVQSALFGGIAGARMRAGRPRETAAQRRDGRYRSFQAFQRRVRP